MRRRTLRLGLQLKLMMAMLLVCVLALAGVLGYTAINSRGLVDSKAAEDLTQSSDQIDAHVSAWYEKLVTHIHSVSRLPQFTEKDLQVASATLRAAVKDLPEVDSARIVDPAGMEIVHSIDGAMNKYDDRQWFKEAMQGKDPSMQTLISKSTGKPSMVLAVPLRDAQNKVVGVLEYTVGLDKLTSLVKGAAGTRLTAILADSTGKALVGRAGDATMADLKELAPVAGAIKTNRGALTYADESGDRWLADYRKLGDTEWTLVTQLHENEVMAEGRTYVQHVLQWGLTGSAGVILLVVLVAFLIGRNIARPVQQLSAAAERMAGGDLTMKELPARGDELGDLVVSFNRMVAGLRTLVQGMTLSAETLSGTAQTLTFTTSQMAETARGVTVTVSQVAASAGHQSETVGEIMRTVNGLHEATRQIAAGAEEQSRSAQETVSIVDRMVSAVEDARQSTEQIMAASSQATAVAEAGSKIVNNSVAGMERIRETVDASASQLHALGQISAQIGQITSAITEIADQTNLLALNAAIEAARAGEHGRGFAVVADEVRKLAERSAKSTGEIAALVQSIQGGTEEAVRSMERIQTEVKQGASQTREAGGALQEIITVTQAARKAVDVNLAASERCMEAAREVMEAVNAVSAVSEENTATTEQMTEDAGRVSDNVQSMAAIAEENAAASEEVTASMEEATASADTIATSAADLAGIARELTAQVSQFKL